MHRVFTHLRLPTGPSMCEKRFFRKPGLSHFGRDEQQAKQQKRYNKHKKMFRNGPEGLRGRAGSRPWRPSGHARVAIMLMFNAVATCTSPPGTFVPYIVPDVQSRVYGHPFHALSSLLGGRTSHGSVHLPSGAAANPESPVLGVAPQRHRIRKLRAATKSPEQRVDAQTTASSLTPHSKQRVNSSAGATSADSLMHASHTAWLPRCRSNFDGFFVVQVVPSHQTRFCPFFWEAYLPIKTP
jgi:hypothetical protein